MSKPRSDYSHSQHHVRQKDDGYVRMRCQECGRKLKAPKEWQGQMFTCRHCKTQNVLPFLDEAGVAVDDGSADRQLGHDGTALSERQPDERWAPEVRKRVARIQEVDQLMNSIFQAYRDALTRAQNMLADGSLTHDQQKAELVKTRRDLSMSIRGTVIRIRETMGDKVAKLRKHPLSKSVQIREQLDEAIRQHTAFSLLAECLFD